MARGGRQRRARLRGGRRELAGWLRRRGATRTARAAADDARAPASDTGKALKAVANPMHTLATTTPTG